MYTHTQVYKNQSPYQVRTAHTCMYTTFRGPSNPGQRPLDHNEHEHLPQGSMFYSTVHTWAMKRFLYPYSGVFASAAQILGRAMPRKRAPTRRCELHGLRALLSHVEQGLAGSVGKVEACDIHIPNAPSVHYAEPTLGPTAYEGDLLWASWGRRVWAMFVF